MAYGVEAFVLRTAKRSWTRVYQSNQTGETVTTLGTLDAPPVGGNGYIDCANSNVAKMVVFGRGTEDFTIETRLWTISKVHSHHTPQIYVPTYICKLTWTLGTMTGTGDTSGEDATAIPVADVFCDSVQLDQGDTSIRLITDTENNAASVTVDLEGASWLYVGFNEPGSHITEYNAAVGLF